MAIERRVRALLAGALLAVAWSGSARADLVASPPEPCELLPEGAACHIDGIERGVCRGKKAWERKCVALPDAAEPTVQLGDAIDAAPPFADPVPPDGAAPADAADEPAVPVPPRPASSGAVPPAPPPTRVSGCAGCRVGHPERDPELWVAAVLFAIGALARRRR